MEIVTYVQGEDIIVQNDVGDAFYVIEMGRVKVMRKNNAYEVAHEIRQMTKGAFFGELSLLNEEPRSATVTVVSETARALKLSKTMFDELVKVTPREGTLVGWPIHGVQISDTPHTHSHCIQSAKNPFAAGKRKEIAGKDITDKVPIFKSLSAALKRKILETMQTVTFPPGSYICKQGAQGNSFYVLTLGSAKITIDGEDFVEREVNRIHPGDFFGEAALLDAANKRTANVIAIDTVTCMTLTKAEFNYLLKGVKGAMNRDHQTRRKSDMNVMYRAQDGERVRRITAMNAANTRHDQRSGRYIKCLSRAVFESLYLNVYARMFRSLLLTEMAVVEYGEIAFRIVTHHRDPAAGVVAIRLAAMDILSKVLRPSTAGRKDCVEASFVDIPCPPFPLPSRTPTFAPTWRTFSSPASSVRKTPCARASAPCGTHSSSTTCATRSRRSVSSPPNASTTSAPRRRASTSSCVAPCVCSSGRIRKKMWWTMITRGCTRR